MRKNILLLIAFLGICLLDTLPLHARHVRAYCFMSNDSLSVYEDSCVRLSVVFDQKAGHVVANILNKTHETIYLRGYGSTAITNGEKRIMTELENVSAYPLSPGINKRIHGWNLLAKKLDDKVVEQGKCRNAFQWTPGHKGAFINQANGSRKRFKKGMCMNYTPQSSPLCLAAHVVYATSKDMEQLYTAEACLYVSDIAVGRRHKNIKEDKYIPSEFYDRQYFHFDSGGCDALPYVGGIVTMSVGYVSLGLVIITFSIFEDKITNNNE